MSGIPQERRGVVDPGGALELAPGVVVDARRAVWLPGAAALLVADVHLGYVWAERQRGALLPLVEEDAGTRLTELLEAYPARRLVFLGDTVHATARNEVLEQELREVLGALRRRVTLEFVLGNHDVKLEELLARVGVDGPAARRMHLGPHVLVHGDAVRWIDVAFHRGDGGWVFSGHEHPAVRLGDGVATALKVPAFLVGRRRLVLPAFSRWSAGQVIGRQPSLSPLVDAAALRHAVVVLGTRVLPVALDAEGAVSPCSAAALRQDPEPEPSLRRAAGDA